MQDGVVSALLILTSAILVRNTVVISVRVIASFGFMEDFADELKVGLQVLLLDFLTLRKERSSYLGWC